MPPLTAVAADGTDGNAAFPELERPRQLPLIPPLLTCLLIRAVSSHQGLPSFDAARRRRRSGLLPVVCDPGVGSWAHALGRVEFDAPALRVSAQQRCASPWFASGASWWEDLSSGSFTGRTVG